MALFLQRVEKFFPKFINGESLKRIHFEKYSDFNHESLRIYITIGDVNVLSAISLKEFSIYDTY